MPEWSDPIVKVYEDCTDAILVNIARHFPIDEEVSGTFTWQARKLAEMGQLTQENAEIIARMTGQNVERVQQALSGAASEALKDVEPELAAAAEKGFLPGAPPVEMSPRMENILSSYSAQAVDQLNLVNTVMLDSSMTAFQKVVADTVVWEQRAMTMAEKQAAQQILNTATAEVATGVTAHQSAVRKAVKQMADAGLTGFVDRGGHNWSPEAYVRMDIRTTCGNVATQSVFARNADYGNDLIWVRTKAAARPGCFPYQGGVFSKDGRSGVTEDLRGNKIQFQPLSSTTYGEPAGLFGINCGHVPPNPFVPGFSMVRNAIDVDDPEVQKENERLYAMSQEERALERSVREAKRDAAMAAATGDKEMFDVYAAQVKKAQEDLRAFTKANNLADREYLTQVAGYDRSVAAKATWSVKKQNQNQE